MSTSVRFGRGARVRRARLGDDGVGGGGAGPLVAGWLRAGMLGAGLVVSALLPGCGEDDEPLAPVEVSRARGFRFPEQVELSFSEWGIEPAFPKLTFVNPVYLAQAPGSEQLFVAEREGRIWAFQHRADVDEKRLVLDLSAVNQGEDDSGLLSFAFHPEFGAEADGDKPYLYVCYQYTPEPIVGEQPPENTQTWFRLSRFTLDASSLEVDTESELVLIHQRDESVWHQGGAMFFHPEDGFLYLTTGDEGGTNCVHDNCQRIDKDLFGGVLRIDVDERGGDVSHPIVRQPATGETAHYYIPNDNPFVGQEGVLEEFYALGLRSPHRMTYDPVSGVTFIGEVGQEQQEEINVLARGANYQWAVYEGEEIFIHSDGELPDPLIGVWTDPLLTLNRDESRSVIGGYVYRGRRFPELQGKYVFGDFEYGHIWATEFTHGGGSGGGRVEVVDNPRLLETPFRGRSNGITSFGVDAAGELYVLTLGAEARVMQLTRDAEGSPGVPQLLSRTGLFLDVSELEPHPALVRYGVNSPLWSDGLEKVRWLSLPGDLTADIAEMGSWSFPAGSVFVKHFQVPEAIATERRHVETRVLVVEPSGTTYGLTYAWNEAQTDAELVVRGRDIERWWDEPSDTPATYYLPGPQDCLECHHDGAGSVLGLRTAQLNRKLPEDHPLREQTALPGQLSALQSVGVVDAAIDLEALPELTTLARLDDESATLEHRMRSYWDSNCSMCHGTKELRSAWDARITTPLAEQGIIDGAVVNGGGEGEAIVVPGSPERSVLFQRDTTTDVARRMPPLGRALVDEAYAQLLEEWIVGLGEE